MEKGKIVKVTLLSLLFCIRFFRVKSERQSELFQMSPCSSSRYDAILKAPSNKETNLDSVLRCADSCRENPECNFAVFRKSTLWCKHVFSYEGSSSNTVPDYTEENDCVVLHKKHKPVCQNGGDFPGDDVCVCPDEYHGRECEETKPGFCNANMVWREAATADYDTLASSELEIKLLTRRSSTTKLSNINFLAYTGGTLRFQSHNFLSVNSATNSFEVPLKREFNFYTTGTSTLTTNKVSMQGTLTPETFSNVDYKVLMQDVVDNDRLVYSSSSHGTLDELTDKLNNGHRLMLREPTRSEIYRNTGDVVYQLPRFNIGAGTKSVSIPLYFYSAKYSTKDRYSYIIRWYVATYGYISSSSGSSSIKIELDRCWIKIPLGLFREEIIGLMTDVVLSMGKELRLVMAASVATDVTMVTITDSDIVVALAEYLTPSDPTTDLGTSTKIVFSIASLSKTLTECEVAFQGKPAHRVTNSTFQSDLEWVMSSRTWLQRFVLTSSAVAVFGSHSDVYSAAVVGRSIRVCVEKTLHVSTCFTASTLTLDDSSRHVTIQSPAALSMLLRPDRTFSGNVGPDCQRTVYLVSTEGWVKAASYVVGVEDPPDAVVTVNFLKMTWFEQG